MCKLNLLAPCRRRACRQWGYAGNQTLISQSTVKLNLLAPCRRRACRQWGYAGNQTLISQSTVKLNLLVVGGPARSEGMPEIKPRSLNPQSSLPLWHRCGPLSFEVLKFMKIIKTGLVGLTLGTGISSENVQCVSLVYSEEEVSQRKGTSATLFYPALDPPLGRSGQKKNQQHLCRMISILLLPSFEKIH